MNKNKFIKFSFLPLVMVGIFAITSCNKPNDDGPSEPEVVEQYFDVTMDPSLGYDIYQMPTTSGGYRYGPSILVEEKEGGEPTIHAWFASSGFDYQCWDIFSYKKSLDGGKTWSTEKVVTMPVPASLEHYSVCDPSVIKYGGYYYMGYTSTPNANQRDNYSFICRSTSPEGPWDKWNGTSWGGDNPQPITWWEEDYEFWGSGEPSIVVKGNEVFIYYTREGMGGRVSNVLVGDITKENWPATLEEKGVAFGVGSNDSVDVAYVEEYDMFLGIATDDRFTSDSHFNFYQSKDGLTFTLVDICKENTIACMHNCGISKNELGHITPTMKPFVGYAYQSGPGSEHWGIWNTRFQNITIGIQDEPDYSELSSKNVSLTCQRDNNPSTEPVGIVAYQPNVGFSEYAHYSSTSSFTIDIFSYTSNHVYTRMHGSGVTYTGYDPNVIAPKTNTTTINIVGVGMTQLIVNWNGFHTIVKVRIVAPNTDETIVTKVEPMCTLASSYIIDASNRYQVQPKVRVHYNGGVWKEMFGNGVTFSNYDSSLISVNNGYVTPSTGKTGTSTLTMTVGGKSTTVNIIVKNSGLDFINFEDVKTVQYVCIGRTNTKFNNQRGYALLQKTAGDPNLTIKNSWNSMVAEDVSKISITYRIPTNTAGTTKGAFYWASASNTFVASQMKMYDMTADNEWHTVEIDMSDATNWNSANSKYIRYDYFEIDGYDELHVKNIKFLA